MNRPLTASEKAAIDFRRECEANELARRSSPYTCSQSITLAATSPSAYVPAYTKGLKILDSEQLLTTTFPPRSLMLKPWLPDKGTGMIFAPRGVGKTWIALSIAHSIAGGGEFLRWRAPRPRRVLYIDGEMPAALLQERYTAVVAALMLESPTENFRLLAADVQPDGLPDLADVEAQRFYDSAIADAELIIVDNLSTIARGLRENEADSYGPVQSWLLAQRAAGRSVLLIHHAGKGGRATGNLPKRGCTGHRGLIGAPTWIHGQRGGEI